MKYLLPFLCCLISVQSIAQQTSIVISTNGLKLREAPNQNARVLAVAPFGAKVQQLTVDTGQYGQVEYNMPIRRDTIGTLFPLRYNSRSAGHIGYWLQVLYQGKTGYMFSGFLADSAQVYYQSDMGEINNNFRLRNTDGNAGSTNNPEFDPNWYWYGLFLQADSNFAVRKVQPRYAVEDHTDSTGAYEFYAAEIVIQTDPPGNPLLIIGTRKPWKTRTGISGYWSIFSPNEPYLPGTNEPDPDFLKKYQLDLKKETISTEGQNSWETPVWYILGRNGQRQRIEPLESFHDYWLYLTWIGDLDGDGRFDYVFNNGGPEGYYVLYLSSLAKAGEVARPAAVLWTWYTC